MELKSLKMEPNDCYGMELNTMNEEIAKEI